MTLLHDAYQAVEDEVHLDAPLQSKFGDFGTDPTPHANMTLRAT